MYDWFSFCGVQIYNAKGQAQTRTHRHWEERESEFVCNTYTWWHKCVSLVGLACMCQYETEVEDRESGFTATSSNKNSDYYYFLATMEFGKSG